MEFLASHSGWILLACTALILIPISAFILRNACGICGQDLPTFRKAMVVVPATTLAAFFAWDFVGYGMVHFSQEAFPRPMRPTIAAMGYTNWFALPLSVRYQLVDAIPMVSKTPYIFAFCVAGMFTVGGLTVPFRIGIMVLALQWIMNLIVFATLNFLVMFVFHLAVRQFPEQTKQLEAQIARFQRQPSRQAKEKVSAEAHMAGLHQTLQTHAGNTDPVAPPNPDATGHAMEAPSDEGVQGLPRTVMASSMDYLANANELVHPYLEKMNDQLKPIAAIFPERIRNFLERGGWWLFICLAMVIISRWMLSVGALVRKKLKSGKTARKVDRKVGKLDLAALGPCISKPGRIILCVKGIPCRIRAFVISPAGNDSGELHIDMAETIADYIKPGMGNLVDCDYPLLEVWNRQFSSSGFPYTFFSNMIVPEKKGKQSPWILLAGTVTPGQFKVHVGIALECSELSSLAKITIKDEQWLDVLSLKEVA